MDSTGKTRDGAIKQLVQFNGDKAMEVNFSSKKKLNFEETFTLEEKDVDVRCNSSGGWKTKANSVPCACDGNHLVATSLVLAVIAIVFFAFSFCLLTGRLPSMKRTGEERVYLGSERLMIAQNTTTTTTVSEETMANDEARSVMGTTVDPSDKNRVPVQKYNVPYSQTHKPTHEDKKVNDSVLERFRIFFDV